MMRSLDSLTARGIMFFAFPVLIQCCLLLYLWFAFQNARAQERAEAHSREIVVACLNLELSAIDAVRNRVFSSVGQGIVSHDEYDESKGKFAQSLVSFRELAKDRPQLASTIKQINELPGVIEQLGKEVEEFAETKLASGRDIQNALESSIWLSWFETAFDYLGLHDRVMEAESADFDKSRETAEKRLALRHGMAFALGVNLLIACIVSWFYGHVITSRLKQAMDNTRKLSVREPLNPTLGGSDEIAQLDLFLHKVDAAIEDARRKEKTLVEGAADVIASLDSELNVESMNPAVHHMIGRTAEEMLGSNFLDVVPASERDRFQSQLENIMNSQQRAGTFETKLLRFDGSAVDVLCSMHWSQLDNALFCVIHDISEARELERLKESFVQMVSHDLRSPLMSISGSIELLVKGAYGQVTESAKSELKSAESNVRRLIALINDLLDMEKLRSGKLQLQLAPCNLPDVVARSILAVRSFAEGANVSIVEVPSSETIPETLADEDKLVQVIVNLLGNAIKFSTTGDTVRIETRVGDNEIEVRVIDNGPGIAEENQSLIFKPFEQVAGSGRETSGSGLGLAICKAIIDSHSGTIGVTSQPGKGSTFWFRLPG